MRASRIRALSAGLALLALAAGAQAEPRPRARVVERVIAVVDGRPIWLSELRALLHPYELTLRARKLTGAEAARASTELKKQVFERLIERQLVAGEAARTKLTASAAEIEAAIDSIAKANATGREQIFAAAREQGFSDASYRAEVGAQLLEAKLLRLWMARRGLEAKGDAREIENAMASYAVRWHEELRNAAHVEKRYRP